MHEGMSLKERMRKVLLLMEEQYRYETETPVRLGAPFKILIECVLSHRTRSENSHRAAKNLFQKVSCAKDVLAIPSEELKSISRCSGFYNKKSRSIRAICEMLLEKYGGVVPRERAELMSLPGVGPKTADIVLSRAYGVNAIAVDVHVATVTRRLGFVVPEANTEEIKKVLESLNPSDKYGFVDEAFFRHGKERCRTRNPVCEDCFLGGFCEFSSSTTRC
jgi:endonuclease-3